MKFTIVTILPELVDSAFAAGVVGRAVEAGVITVDTVNPRDFTKDKHRTVDDTPYGGGPGMVMKPEPLLAAIAKAMEQGASNPPLREQDITAAALRELQSDTDALGQPVDPLKPLKGDPLKKVERAIAKVESMLGSLGGDAGPLTTDVHLDRATSDAADAEAALAQIEKELGREASDISTKPVALIEDDIDLNLPARNERRGALGPAEERATAPREVRRGALGPADEGVTAPGDAGVTAPGDAGVTEPGDAGESEMPNLVEPANVVATPPAGVPVVPPPTTTAATTTAPTTTAPTTTAPTTTAPTTTAPATTAPTTTAPTTTATPSKPHRILLSPSGTPLTQARVRELAQLDHLILVCGRYEGVDQRVIDLAIDEEISRGDYVLSGGELGALVIIDAVSRLVPGVLGEPTSADDESFSEGLLEYPQYTRPHEITMPAALQSDRVASPVPAVLQSGNHAAIRAWRREQSMRRTASRRPDLWRQFRPTKADDKLLPPLRKRTHVALVHHPVTDRTGTVVTSSLTNFDIHDIARSSMTYGLAGYHIVTPVTAQREKAEHIAKLWIESEQGEHRAAALRLIHTADSVDAVIAALTAEHGQAPTVVATSARPESFGAAERRTSSALLAEASLSPAPLLLLLGTGWGLADALIPSVSRVLAPIEGASEWNHLSVRSAGAVILDRLFGKPA